jgi:SNF2 family DNA or RNA helicase
MAEDMAEKLVTEKGDDGFGSDHFSLKASSEQLIKKHKNPFKILYLWCSQELLDVRALLDAFAMRDKLENTRKDMMKKISMTEQEVFAMRPSTSGSVKELFNDDGNTEKVNKKLNSGATHDAQKDIVTYVQINEMLTSFLCSAMLPRFKAEKAENYRKILKQFSIMEIENSVNYSKMWSNVMNYHNKRAE